MAKLNNDKSRPRSGGNANFFRVPMGKTTIRLCPLNDGDALATRVSQIFVNGKPYIEPEVTHGATKSPLLRAYETIKSRKDKKSQKLAGDLRPSTRYWVLAKIISSDSGENVGEIMVVQLPRDCYAPIYDAYDTDGIDVSDPKKGFDVRLTRKGSGLSTEYSATIPREPRALTKEELAEMTAAKKDYAVDALLKYDIKEQARLAEALLGNMEGAEDDEDSEDEDEDEAPKGKKGKPAPKGKAKDDEDEDSEDEEEESEDDEDEEDAAEGETEDDEEDEDSEDEDSEDEEDEEDEEEEAPKGKKGKPAPKGKAKDDEDEDEEESETEDEDEEEESEDDEDEDSEDEEDEDEEEEAPKGKKGKPAPKGKAKDDEDEDSEDEDEEDEDEEDEDEEEAPKGKKGKPAPKRRR